MSIGQSTTPGLERTSHDRQVREALKRVEQLERTKPTYPLPTVETTGTVRIPPISLLLIADFTADLDTPLVPLDWGAASIVDIESNDPGGASSLADITDPFDGDWYEIDWTAEPTDAFAVKVAGTYVWQATFGGARDIGLPAPPSYTVMVGCNQSAEKSVFFHADPTYEGPPQTGNFNWEHAIAGVRVVEANNVPIPFQFMGISDFDAFDLMRVAVTISKVADYASYDLDLATVVS